MHSFNLEAMSEHAHAVELFRMSFRMPAGSVEVRYNDRCIGFVCPEYKYIPWLKDSRPTARQPMNFLYIFITY